MKTKTIILAIALVLGLSPLARAQSATAFDYTGISASDENYGFGTSWISGHGNGSSAEVWPSAQAGDMGIAQQFTISVPTLISALDTSVLVYQPPYQGPLSTTLTWDIYSSSLSPVPGYLEFASAPVTYTASGSVPTTTVNQQLAFNADLQPGTYWIAEQGTGDAALHPSQEYIDPSPSGNTAQTPEPTVWVFFALLVAFIIWKGRKDALERLV